MASGKVSDSMIHTEMNAAAEYIILEALFQWIGPASTHSVCNSIRLHIWSLLLPFDFAYPLIYFTRKVSSLTPKWRYWNLLRRQKITFFMYISYFPAISWHHYQSTQFYLLFLLTPSECRLPNTLLREAGSVMWALSCPFWIRGSENLKGKEHILDEN